MRPLMLIFACALCLPLYASGQSLTLTPPTPSKGLESALCPARPTKDNTLLITGARATVYVPKGSYVDFRPALKDQPNFQISHAILYVDDRQAEIRDIHADQNIGVFRVTMDAARRKRVVIVAEDEFHKTVVLNRTLLLGYAPPVPPEFTLQEKQERLHIAVANRDKFKTLHTFLMGTELGRMTSGNADFDTRHLAVGTYVLTLIGETPEGDLVAPVRQEFSIASRFKIELTGAEQTVQVTQDNPNPALPIRITRAPHVAEVRAQVYLAGFYIGEDVKQSFDLAAGLKRAPTGEVIAEVYAYGKDKIAYPPESVSFNVKNLPWEIRTYNTDEYARISANRRLIQSLDKDLAYWRELAANEPDYNIEYSETLQQTRSSTGRVVTLRQINATRLPSEKKNYLANARRSLMQMAQALFENGKLYRVLGMRQHAKNAFQRVVRLVGEDAQVGRMAQAELNALTQPDPEGTIG